MAASSKQKALTKSTGSSTPRDLPGPVRANVFVERLETWGHSIWRHRWLSMATAWLICLMGWAAVALWPANFVASAVIHADLAELIKKDVTGVSQDQTPSTILRSLLLSDVTIGDARSRMSLETADIQSLRDKFHLRSSAAPVFVLTYTHQDPDIARNMLEAVIDSFKSTFDGPSVSSTGAASELNSQIEDYQQRIQSAEADLAAFKDTNADYLGNESSRDTELSKLTNDLADLERQLATTTAERDSIAAELATARIPDSEPASTSAPKSIEDIETERKTLEAELSKLQERYADTHPYVVDVLDAIQSLDDEAEAASGPPEEPAGADRPPIDLEALEERHQELIAEVASLNSRLVSKRSEIELLEALTRTASSVEAELAELESDNEGLNVALTNLLERRSELGGLEVTQAERTPLAQGSFRLIKEPMSPTDPAGPSRLMALAAVLVGGTGLGAAIALVCNRVKGVFESAWQLRRRFDVGVLGTISEVMTPAERKQLGYSRLAFGLAGLALFGVFSGLAFAELTDRLAPLGDQLRLQFLG